MSRLDLRSWLYDQLSARYEPSFAPCDPLGQPLRKRIFDQYQAGDRFSITTPILSEFLFGILGLPCAQLNLLEWRNIQEQFTYYRIDIIDTEAAAELRVDLRKRGWQLTLFDALTAVIALRNNLVLLTTDRDFQAIPNLQHENWRIA
jgi:tRNA(fMet)-specific endonuclease VapC